MWVFELIFLLFQDHGSVCPQEVRQDDEDLQPRQGLQEEQQVRSLLSPHQGVLPNNNQAARMQRLKYFSK